MSPSLVRLAAPAVLSLTLLGAAGAQEAIYSILMLNNGFAAQSANIENLDPEFADLPILTERSDKPLETVMGNSFGFGGTNGCLIMARV